jgi:hypothetical protein
LGHVVFELDLYTTMQADGRFDEHDLSMARCIAG